MRQSTRVRLNGLIVLAAGLGIWSGCDDDGVSPDRTPGSLVVTTTTSGKDPDPDGYTVSVDGGLVETIGLNETLSVENLAPGEHDVELGGLAPACAAADGTNPGSAVIIAGETTSMTFEVVCQAALEDQIAFWSFDESDPQIFVMDADGSNQFQLTREPGGASEPAISPDGTGVLFVSDRDGNQEIYVMNANGSGVERLTHNQRLDWRPRWSPDGSRIAFSSDREDPSSFDIFVMNADGSDPVNLTGESHGTAATWSPDGTEIAFTSNRTGEFEIFVMNADGSDPVNLTNDPDGSDYAPAWSPDGARIAYARDPEISDDVYGKLLGPGEIFVMNTDGSNRTNVTNHGDDDTRPSWSPDGTKIVFTSYRTGEGEVFVMNADGTSQLNLSTRPDTPDQVGFPQGWR